MVQLRATEPRFAAEGLFTVVKALTLTTRRFVATCGHRLSVFGVGTLTTPLLSFTLRLELWKCIARDGFLRSSDVPDYGREVTHGQAHEVAAVCVAPSSVRGFLANIMYEVSNFVAQRQAVSSHMSVLW